MKKIKKVAKNLVMVVIAEGLLVLACLALWAGWAVATAAVKP